MKIKENYQHKLLEKREDRRRGKYYIKSEVGHQYMYLLHDILVSKSNTNRASFLTWAEKAEKIKKSEFQKEFQDKMRTAYGLDVNNSNMEFLTDKTESAKPSTILKRKNGLLLSFNITPSVETFDSSISKADDVAVVNTFVNNILNKSSYSKQVYKAYDDALYYGTGILKIASDVIPKEHYKIHKGLGVSHVPIKKFICDDVRTEIQDMDFCGEIEYVNGYRAYMGLTHEEKEMYRMSRECGVRIMDGTSIATKFGSSSFINKFNDVDFSKPHNKDKVIGGSEATLVTLYVKDFTEYKGEMIEFKILGDVVVSSKKLKQTNFPYVSISFYENSDNFYGMSLLYLMFDSYVFHLRAKDNIETNLLYASNPVYQCDVTKIATDIDTLNTALNIPGALVPLRTGGAVSRIERGSLTAEGVQAYQLSLQELNDIGGLTDFNTGANSGSITTSGGISSMINASNMITQVDIPTIEHFHKTVLYTILQTVADYEIDIKGMIKSNNKSGVSLREITVTGEMVQNFDIIIKADSEQVNSQNALVALLQLLQMIPPDEEGIYDTLRSSVITSMTDLLPVDSITKSKINRDVADALKMTEDKKESNSKEQVAQTMQQLYQRYGDRMNQLNVSDYMQ